MIDTSRRRFLTGLGSLFVAAPAIVHVGNIMPVRALNVNEALAWSFAQTKEIIAADVFNYYDSMKRWRDALRTVLDAEAFASFPGGFLTRGINEAESRIYREIDMLK